MTNTTKDKSAPEALRMIAEWLDEGLKIQERCTEGISGRWHKFLGHYVIETREYRAKPIKPRIREMPEIMAFGGNANAKTVKIIELTEEVKAALDKEGIDYE